MGLRAEMLMAKTIVARVPPIPSRSSNFLGNVETEAELLCVPAKLADKATGGTGVLGCPETWVVGFDCCILGVGGSELAVFWLFDWAISLA